jgi:hypothetical protein
LRGPKTSATPRFRSAPIVQRRSSLRSLHLNGPKTFPASRSPWPAFVRRRSVPRLAPLDPPKSVSSIAICSTPKAPRPPGSRSRSTQFDPKVHQTSRFGRRGRARSSEESQHSRPPAAYKEPCRSIILCFGHLGTFPVAPFDGLDRRLAAATHDLHPKTSIMFRATSVRCPIVSLARSFRAQRGLMSHLEIIVLTLRIGSVLRRPSP